MEHYIYEHSIHLNNVEKKLNNETKHTNKAYAKIVILMLIKFMHLCKK